MKKTLPLLLMLTLLGGCAGEGDSESAGVDVSDGVDYTEMLAHYADDLIVPQLQQSREAAASLFEDIAAHCEALENGTSALQPARSQWRQTMNQWQRMELLQVGPLVQNGGALRNRIYAYGSSAPLSTCGVDQAVVLSESEGFDLSSRSFNSRGLAALEYLLFNESLMHTCPSQIPQTADWNRRPASERREARCGYARQLANDVQAGIDEVIDAWVSESGDYRYQFIVPANQEDSLKALSDALFYIELESKDAKLGVPLSIHDDCSASACPDAVESPFAKASIDNIQSNLEGFKRAFNGGEGSGFDGLIREEGFADVARAFNRELDAAIALADGIDESLLSQSQRLLASGDSTACLNAAANPEVDSNYPACQLHGLLKRITDRLRTDFITIVNLDLPERGQSDND